MCYLDDGLQKEETIVLCILWAMSADLRSKVLQHFIDREPSIQNLKLFTNNLLSSDYKMSDEVKIVSKILKPKAMV